MKRILEGFIFCFLLTLMFINLINIPSKIEIKEENAIDKVYSANNEINMVTFRNALKEVAYSYYMRGKFIQYNSMKGNPSWFSPEEATSQNINYLVCSAFVKNVYYDLLGVKLPPYTENLLEYAKDNVGKKEVIAYGKRENNALKLNVYDENSENNYTVVTNPTTDDVLKYLKCGDVITYSGHTMLVYDLIYDNNGLVKDAYIIESGHGNGAYNAITKMPKAFSIESANISFGTANTHSLYYNSRNNTTYEDGREEGSLHLSTFKTVAVWKDISNSTKKEYSILRFVDEKDGIAVLNYDGTKYKDSVHNEESIEITDSAKDRTKYSRVYIEKTVDKHNDDVVNSGDELTYKIFIKNNSEKDYTEDILITEDISDYVTYKSYNVEKGDTVFFKGQEENKVKFEIKNLKAGEEVVVDYTVVVKEGYIGKEIKSTGSVGNIPSSVIKNTIGYVLTENQEDAIQCAYEEKKKTYSQRKLINEIYKEAFGVDLNLACDNDSCKDGSCNVCKECFDITDLVVNKNLSSTSSITGELNSENPYFKAVLNKYWNTLCVTKYNYNGMDLYGYDMKLWRPYELSNRRADTIYEENLKTGDILIYTNDHDVLYSYSKENDKVTETPVTYESGEYAYIYIEGEGFVGINLGNDKEVGTQDDRNEYNAQYYKDNDIYVYSNKDETDEEKLEFMNYQTLLGKDYYVILRPALAFDIIPMELEVEYSCIDRTNQDVEVTIKSNEEMWQVEGWTLSEDKKILTKTYTENVEETIIVTDFAGNTIEQLIKIINIDKTPPEVSVKYSTTDLTKEDVKVEITLNEEVQEVEGWTLSKDKKTLTKTYKENVDKTIIITDLAGNRQEQLIKITNIDKMAPEVSVKYSITNKTNGDVTVKVKSNEEIKELEGWTLSEDKKELTKTYTENTEETIIVTDLIGNTKEVIIKVTNIDRIAPEVIVEYSITSKTNENVTVRVKSNEEIQELEDWTLSEDKKELTKTYTENTEETIQVIDLAGNKVEQLIKITNIDKTAPEVSVKYSTTDLTKEDVKVEITLNKEVQELDGWILSDDKKTLTKTYTGNVEETIIVTDLIGNTKEVVIKITNIDKDVPELSVKYSITNKTNGDVTVTVKSNEEIQELEGWTLSEDKKELTKTYTENAEESIIVTDLVGNYEEVVIEVRNIDKIAPEISIEYSDIIETKECVTVTIKSNEELQELEGWTLSEDKKTLTKVYTENVEETVTLKDIAGNETLQDIRIENIGNELEDKLECEIRYSTKELTKENVEVTIILNKEVYEVDTWELSVDKKMLSKTFEENCEEIIEINDFDGNQIVQAIKINNIDKTAPDVNVEYSTTDLTKEDVKVEITLNEEVQEVEGWKLSEDKKILTKTYSENVEETIIITDLAGNTVEQLIKITNIDKTAPEISVKYSTTDLTKEDVKVEITLNEEVQEVEGWTLSEDKKILTKTYSENVEETIIITDLAGNTVEQLIKITNIDKIAPELSVEYSITNKTNGSVVVTVKSNEELQALNGWTLATDNKVLTKVYAENVEETVIVKDLAGNTAEQLIKITNIDKDVSKFMVIK